MITIKDELQRLRAENRPWATFTVNLDEYQACIQSQGKGIDSVLEVDNRRMIMRNYIVVATSFGADPSERTVLITGTKADAWEV